MGQSSAMDRIASLAGEIARLATDEGSSAQQADLSARTFPAARLAQCEALRRSRIRKRAICSDPQVFGDTAWQLLVEVYRSQLLGAPASIDAVSAEVGKAPATATRWVQILIADGVPEPCRGRHDAFAVSPQGRLKVDQVLDSLFLPEGAGPVQV